MSDSTGRLVGELERLGVRLWVDDGQLRFRAPQGVMTPQRRDAVRGHRDEIVDFLAGGGLPRLSADPAAGYEPFPLSDVQSAYLLGRGRTFAYGGVACHGYGELRYPELDPAAMTAAWRATIDRHPMLRAVVEADGAQRVLEAVPPLEIPVTDVRGGGDLDAALAATRAQMDHRVFTPSRWPLFEVRITRADAAAVLHVSVDFLIADFVSIQLLLDEVHRRYHRPDTVLPALEVSFRDYLLTEARWRAGGRHERDRGYWLGRLDELPGAPELPVLATAADSPGRFQRYATTIDPARWAMLRQRAGAHGVTPSTAVLAAYAQTVAAWSRRPGFTLNVTLLNRLPLHPRVPELIGDFTGVELLAVPAPDGAPFAARAAALQAQLWQDMDHRAFSGIEVMRELVRRRGNEAALFPVVFTSAIGLGGGTGADPVPQGELGYGISQTPQVWLDCQNMERDGGLASNWDVRTGVFPDGVVPDMFAAYEALLHRLADDDAAWREPPGLALPPAQAQRRRQVNDTAVPAPRGRLHDGVFAQAARDPGRIAVIAGDRMLTYGELSGRAFAVADALAAAGAGTGDLVGVSMDRGWEQVPAVLGALLAGAAYVPVDTNQPAARRATILANAGIALVLCTRANRDGPWPDGVRALVVDDLAPVADPAARAVTGARGADLAYVIHTSGSTGVPKGVMISHEAALNTVVDINTRFGVDATDRVLGLSQLGFDLSVYDVFGPLAVGGTLVVPDPQRRADPSHWAELIAEHQVSLWNSVPAQLQMLYHYLSSAAAGPHAAASVATLRLALLSGDWIPVALPDQIRALVPELRLISLGGATEASIWSIWYPIGEVRPEWTSIPYGTPLANQTFHVLDCALRPCPDWVTGELYIGGTGVALGYLNDPERTAARFPTHPVTGERLYRTGDLGRYTPDGTIEFLGREDSQVKIRGYRIELAEVETALQGHPGVAAAAVLVDGEAALERRLAAFAVPASRPPAAPAPAELVTAACAAGDRAIAGVDRQRYLRYAHRLDAVALPAMVRAWQAGGLFARPGQAHTYPEILAGAKVAPRHHRLTRRWLLALTREGLLAADGDRYTLTSTVDDATMDQAWQAVRQEVRPQDEDLLAYFQASIAALPALLRGDDDPLALLFPDGRLDTSQRLYEDATFNQWANRAAGELVRRLGRHLAGDRPLRVLEVGAGGGGTTAAILHALSEVDIDYLCTDLSGFFTGQAEQRFAGHPGLRFAVYDLDRDPHAQGLADNSFDVVVAGDVLHATANTDEVLARLRRLLAPGGALVALEMTRDHYQIMTSLELLVRLDEATADFTDARQGTGTLFLDRAAWHEVLTRAGGTDVLCLPGPDGFVAELGMCVLAARFKTDRVPLRPDDLTGYLAERLPGYMVPPVLWVLDELPTTDNGKVDRRALGRLVPRTAEPATAGGYQAPGTDLERALAALWGEALHRGEVGRDDNLFQLGGDSLIAAQLAGRILADLPQAGGLFFDELLRNLLERPTVRQLAQWIAQAAGVGAAEPDAAPAGPAQLLVPLGGDGDGGYARYFLPDATGSLATAAALAGAGTDGATAYGLAGAGLAGLPAVDVVAAGYARAILDRGDARVAVVGCGLTAPLAVEVARHLTERGTAVDLTVVAAAPPDVDPAVAYRAEYGTAPDGPDDPGWATFTAVHAALAGFTPALYAGDLRVVHAAAQPEAVAPWEDLCLGDLAVAPVAVADPHRAGEPGTVAAALAAAR